jgi:hypothetical protein
MRMFTDDYDTKRAFDFTAKAEADINTLVTALRACETVEGAAGFREPAEFARRRFAAINEVVADALAKVGR